MVPPLLRIALFALVVGLPTGPSQGQAPHTQRPFGILVEEWRDTLDAAQLELVQPGLTDGQIRKIEERIGQIVGEAQAAKANAEAQLAPLHGQFQALGPPPGAGEPPETESLAAQRQRLSDNIAFYEARMKQAELAIARTTAVFKDINRLRRERLAAHLLGRGPSPLSPGVWPIAVDETARIARALIDAPAEWWRSDARRALAFAPLAWLLATFLAAAIVYWPLRLWLLRRFGHDPAITAPTYTRRVLAVVDEAAARVLVPAVAVGLLGALLLDQVLAADRLARMVEGATVGFIFFAIAGGLARAAFSPEAPAWSIVPIRPAAAIRIGRRLTGLAVWLAAVVFLEIATAEFDPLPAEMQSVLSLVVDTPIAILLYSLLDTRLWRRADAEEGAEGTRRGGWVVLRSLLRLILIAIPIAALAGYVDLADRLTLNLLLTGALTSALLLVRQILRELLVVLATPRPPREARRKRAPSADKGAGRMVLFWSRVFLDLVLALAGTFLLVLAWGVPLSEIRFFLLQILAGIRIGNLTISITDIVLAILVFAAGMLVTRVVQRNLAEKFLPNTRLHASVQNSLGAAAGYVGVLIAAILAIATVGLNLSNLAIVAGALSVGIGFGLQNIVNNFVSGLILLIERPIKVGDWVSVGSHEGYVKRINVRATELQTFQRADVIIPNSELLSSAVLNWTHRDKYGRLEVRVGVAYGTDVELVRSILLDCAKNHPMVVTELEPTVIFREFGESSLDFELRAYLNDVEFRLTVGSDLRFDIERAFRENGIEIPFPQRDLHFKDIDRLERAVGGGEPPAPAAKDAPKRAAQSAPRRPPRRRDLGEEGGDGDGG